MIARALALLLLALLPTGAARAEEAARVAARAPRPEARLELDAAWLEPVRLRPAVSAPAYLRAEEPPPTALALRLELHSHLTLLVSSDLQTELARLDALDFETYWTARLEWRLRRDTLWLFVEDFQPASAIAGGGTIEDEPAPARSWDGHQFGFGLRWASGRLRAEGVMILSALSAWGRREALGGAAQLEVAW